MIQNAFARHLNNRVRRLIGEELAVVREKVRRGKPLKVTLGKAVFFEPFITFKANSGLDAKAPGKSLRRKQIEAGFPAKEDMKQPHIKIMKRRKFLSLGRRNAYDALAR